VKDIPLQEAVFLK